MLRQGEGPPLVLLHGVLCSERIWRSVVPLVAPYHDTIAITALGHRGGQSARHRPARFEHVIDDAARTLDGLGIEKAHLAGNSMGGWVALELARRGRADSVCAFSPAGFWPAGVSGSSRAADSLRDTIRDIRWGRPFLPILARSSRFRRWAMRLNAVHGNRLRASEIVELADDVLGCEVGRDLLRSDEALAPFPALPCPVTIAWAERDRIFPVGIYAARTAEIVPGARSIVLRDVGHLPMLDSPELVARTVLEHVSHATHAGTKEPDARAPP